MYLCKIYKAISDNRIVPVPKRIGSFLRWKLLLEFRDSKLFLRDKGYTDAKIQKIIYTSPDKIVYETRKKMGCQLDEPGVVYDGCWDMATRPFLRRYKIKSLTNHIKHGVSWEDTAYFDRSYEKIKETGTWRGCSSKEELIEFFNYFDELYDRIKSEGYKKQTQLVKQYPQETKSRINDVTEARHNEIGINIGRNGELLWQCRGQHRLCIAQLLDVVEIPVQVLTRHREWQQIRTEIKNAEDCESLSKKAKNHLQHPDLQDIIPECYDC